MHESDIIMCNVHAGVGEMRYLGLPLPLAPPQFSTLPGTPPTTTTPLNAPPTTPPTTMPLNALPTTPPNAPVEGLMPSFAVGGKVSVKF